jgi:hypothetical protein
VATKSSALNNLPEYLAVLGQKAPDPTHLDDKETVQLATLINGRLVSLTPEIRINDFLRSERRSTHYVRDGDKLRQVLFLFEYRWGSRWSVRVPVRSVNFTWIQPGRASFPNGGSLPQYRTAISIGRRRVSTLLKTRRSQLPRFQQSSSLRPSPERRFKLFTSISQNSTVGPHTIVITPAARMVYERTWTGTRTPGFGKLKQKKLPVNPHSVLIVEEPCDFIMYYDFKFSPPNSTSYTFEVTPFTQVIGRPSRPGHNVTARNKAIDHLKEEAELGIDANLAQDFAQIGQITSLIGTNVSRILKSVRSLKKGQIPQAIGHLTAGRTANKMSKGKPSLSKSVAENWLELQYGWKPLLHDIHGILKVLPTLQTGSPFVQKVTKSGRIHWDSVTAFNSNRSGVPSGLGKHYVRAATRCKISLRWKVASPLTSLLAQTGFTNPINLVWEILPFSFVADWFLPIGPYLESLSTWDGLAFLDGSETNFTITKTDSSVDYSGVSALNNTVFIDNHGQFTRNTIELTRTRLTSFPTLSIPSFKNGLQSLDRATSALALLRATFK